MGINKDETIKSRNDHWIKMLSKGSEEINFHLYQKTPCENMGVKGTFQVVWILAQAEIFKLFTLTSNLSGLWKKNYLKCKH